MGLLGGIINFASEAILGAAITSDFQTSISINSSEEIFEKLIQKWDDFFQKKELVKKFDLSKSSETLPEYFQLGNQNLEICKCVSDSFSFFGRFDYYKWDQQFYIVYKPSKEKELIFSYSNYSQNPKEAKYQDPRTIEAALYLKFISGNSVLEAEKLLVSNASFLNKLQDNNLEKFYKTDEKYEMYNHFVDFFKPIKDFKIAEKNEQERLEKEAKEKRLRELEEERRKEEELERQKEREAQEKENKRISNLLDDLDSI